MTPEEIFNIIHMLLSKSKYGMNDPHTRTKILQVLKIAEKINTYNPENPKQVIIALKNIKKN